jgi:hypothetical protein
MVHRRASQQEKYEGRLQHVLCGSTDQRRRLLAFRKTNTSSGRSIIEQLPVGLVRHTYGPALAQTFENAQIHSGTWMEAVLGPDQSNVSSYYRLGTKTNSNSLRPFMTALADDSHMKGWIAGHLLNEEMGGQGDRDENLTPLTTRANSAHKAYEAHIKKMLLQCHRIDREKKEIDAWYGVHYRVNVSTRPVFQDLIDTYVASHISIEYRYIKIEKKRFPVLVIEQVGPLDPNLHMLKIAGKPASKSTNAVNEQCNQDNTRFSVEIHNENS